MRWLGRGGRSSDGDEKRIFLGYLRRQQVLDDLKVPWRYWNWKEETLDYALWRIRLGRGCEPIVRQTGFGDNGRGVHRYCKYIGIRTVTWSQLNTENPQVRIFRLLWPCIMNVGWRERNQHDATNLVFIIKLLSQHVWGIIMPIFRRTRLNITAYGVLHYNKRGKNRKMREL